MLRGIVLNFVSGPDGLNLLLKEGAECGSCSLIIKLRKDGGERILACVLSLVVIDF